MNMSEFTWGEITPKQRHELSRRGCRLLADFFFQECDSEQATFAAEELLETKHECHIWSTAWCCTATIQDGENPPDGFTYLPLGIHAVVVTETGVYGIFCSRSEPVDQGWTDKPLSEAFNQEIRRRECLKASRTLPWSAVLAEFEESFAREFKPKPHGVRPDHKAEFLEFLRKYKRNR